MPDHWREYFVQESLECGWCIAETVSHDQGFMLSKVMAYCGIFFVSVGHPDQLVCPWQIATDEELCLG
jgi:hypothetical protein